MIIASVSMATDHLAMVIVTKALGKVEKILKGSLDSIQSHSTSRKIQIMGGKLCLRCKGKTLMIISNVLSYYPK